MKRVYLIALIVALIAGATTYWFANNLVKSTKIEGRDTKEVLVALVDIPSGTKITKEDEQTKFVKKNIVVDYATPGAIANFDDIVGRVLKAEILMNEQISSTKFMDENSDEAGLSYNMIQDEYGYSIIAEGVQGVDGYIIPGDSIDILVDDATAEALEGIDVEDFTNLEVLKVGSKQVVADAQTDKKGDGNINTYTSFTLRVNKEIAEELFQLESTAERIDGTFKFILHSRVDTEKYKLENADVINETDTE